MDTKCFTGSPGFCRIAQYRCFYLTIGLDSSKEMCKQILSNWDNAVMYRLKNARDDLGLIVLKVQNHNNSRPVRLGTFYPV